MRKPVIGVMGGAEVDSVAVSTARTLGRLIAERGWILLNGGRSSGIMAASAAGAKAAGGLVIGVLPDRDAAAASDDLDIAVVTGLGDARNLINVLSSDVVLACPGGAGTLSEVALAVKNGRPVILVGFDPGPALAPYRIRGLLATADDPQQAIDLATRFLEDLRDA